MRDALLKALQGLLISSDQPEEAERVLEALAASVMSQLVQPIDTAPLPGLEPTVLFLYCPEHGGWHSAVWWNGAWRLHYNLDTELRPTPWVPTMPDPAVTTEAVIELATEDGVRRSRRH